MAERYTRVFALEHQLYTEGSPLIICAGALLKDNVDDKMVAQIKFRNIRSKTIKAVVAQFQFYDVWNQCVIQNYEFSYLDLMLSRGQETGAKTPVVINDSSVRSFDVTITKVAFEDESVWKSNKEFDILPKAQSLNNKISNNHLMGVYRTLNGEDKIIVPFEHKDVWVCGCGEFNNTGEICYKCKSRYSDLILWLDEEKLSKEKKYREANVLMKSKSVDSYESALKLLSSIDGWKNSDELHALCQQELDMLKKIEEERRIKDKLAQEKERAELDARKRKNKKILSVVIPITVVVFGTMLWLLWISPLMKYNQAIALFESGNYLEARDMFEDINGFKDSEQWIETTICEEKYIAGKKLLENGEYDAAGNKFFNLNYKDSEELLCIAQNEPSYLKVQNYMQNKEYGKALQILKNLKGYKNSDMLINEASLKNLDKKAGEKLVFGRYMTSPTEWVVLERKNDKILVVSEYLLEDFKYDDSNSLWKTSDIRKWLNGAFFEGAFDELERKKILSTEIDGVSDKVFLLSKKEVEKYMPTNKSRQAKYAEWINMYINGTKYGYWWLRTSKSGSGIDFVDESGEVADHYWGVGEDQTNGVRPAMWISIE